MSLVIVYKTSWAVDATSVAGNLHVGLRLVGKNSAPRKQYSHLYTSKDVSKVEKDERLIVRETTNV